MCVYLGEGTDSHTVLPISAKKLLNSSVIVV